MWTTRSAMSTRPRISKRGCCLGSCWRTYPKMIPGRMSCWECHISFVPRSAFLWRRQSATQYHCAWSDRLSPRGRCGDLEVSFARGARAGTGPVDHYTAARLCQTPAALWNHQVGFDVASDRRGDLASSGPTDSMATGELVATDRSKYRLYTLKRTRRL